LAYIYKYIYKFNQLLKPQFKICLKKSIMFQKFIRNDPQNPVLITIPHSGDFYPDIFLEQIKLDLSKIRKIEDFKSDEIIKFINEDAADILIAKCSRAVLDLNRSRKALDNNMFKEIILHSDPHEKKMLSYGLGVLPKLIQNDNIFKSKLTTYYGNHILETFYDPFHLSIQTQIEVLLSKFGICYHFDLHSMPQRAVKNMKKIPDIVLGDNYRKSCSLELINYIKDQFEKNGLIVSINQPYAGGFITRNYGNPSKGIETMQIEVNRSLYMDEDKLLLKNIEPIQKIFSEIFNFFSYNYKIAAE